MTEQTTGKVAQLTPEEWKQLVLLNAAQLQNYLQGIPGNTETGVSGLSDKHMSLIAGHVDRFQTFLIAWSKARIMVSPPVSAEASAPEADAPAHANGAEPAAKKGGWPKGKKRSPKQPEAAQ